MVSVDISLIFITLVVGLILTLLGYMLREWLLYLFSAIYGMMTLTYFSSNFDSVTVGSLAQTYLFWPEFTLAYLFLLIVLPLVLLYKWRLS